MTLSLFLMKISVNWAPNSTSEAVWLASRPPSSGKENKTAKFSLTINCLSICQFIKYW